VRRSLHIGLNNFDPAVYGQDGTLLACEADAASMRTVAIGRGFEPSVLLTKAATVSSVLTELKELSQTLGDGDFLFLTYSGHGGQVEDASGDEPDRLDETWCLYDGHLVDDEIESALADFAVGVRIFVLSDSCHSGSVTRAAVEAADRAIVKAADRTNRPKRLTLEESMRALEVTRDLVTSRLEQIAKRGPLEPQADLILISGCRDDQLSLDGTNNGAFTAALLDLWSDGAYAGSYNDLIEGLLAKLPHTQQPELLPNSAASRGFVREQVLSN